ncbi:MAG: 16S rRNA (guanine(966)-N(2))-methyltransferase RsmD [Clostridia bacterium]|nr:16S rRNA (guanine(966)-N(2))-methyltransferase RsmD [Clostridia bacterium]
MGACTVRVITGSARGRVLKTLEGEDVRPTTDRVKEAIFSIIQFEIEGREVLDLFAGSGQLGIEALSRDAAYATFVDLSKDAVGVIKSNLLSTGLHKNSAVLQSDAFTFLRNSKKKFDIVFMDPPYSKGLLQKALPLVAEVMNDGGVIVCEHPYGEEMPQEAGRFSIYREYKYSKLALTVYRLNEGADAE